MRCLLALLLTLPGIAVAAGSGDASSVLVDYDFDGAPVETGPYTVMVFENSRGGVSLSSTYKLSGHRSVEIHDVPGDRDFAELQGYFLDRSSGKLFLHFAFLTAEADGPINIAFAGRAHFTLRRDGIGFWLQGRDGVLYHFTNAVPVKLFDLAPFTWYVADVTYDIDGGRYDLTLRQEGREQPLVELRRQVNAVGLAGSMLHKYSFIGAVPWEPRGATRLYVDDIRISADEPVDQGPFVAPGRRMLFVDIWDYYRSRLYENPGCPPVLGHADFGFSDSELRALTDAGHWNAFQSLADGSERPGALPDVDPVLRRLLRAMLLWRAGCAQTQECSHDCRRQRLEQAAQLAPRAKVYPMSIVMALAAQGRWRQADELFLSVYPDWHDDPRFPAISAALGIARGDLAGAEVSLQTAADRLPESDDGPALRRLWSGEFDRSLAQELRTRFPEDWTDYVETALVLEHRYYVLLWQKRFTEARTYAARMTDRLRRMRLPAARWLERNGDAAFYDGDYVGALQSYEAALGERTNPTPLLLKLSDVHFKLGNVELERAYRERIYGSLVDEERGTALPDLGLHDGDERALECPVQP